jgi:hypothetical protein
MCSLEEAWQDINYTSTHEDFRSKVGEASQQQMEMDRQHSVRAQQEMDTRVKNTYQPDKVGDVVGQANDRRQYAKPAQDIFHHDWERAMRKPVTNHDFIRGVHDKYNRNETPRVGHRGFYNGQLQTLSEMTSPKPANDNGFTNWNSLYMLNPATQENNSSGEGDAFTQEFINNEQLQRQSNMKMIEYNRKIDQSTEGNSSNNSSNTKNDIQTNIVNEEINKKRSLKLEEEIMNLMKEMKRMELRMKMLEQKITNVDNNRSHDIILYGVVLVFVLFIVYQTFMC